jgi:hypothetical protein
MKQRLLQLAVAWRLVGMFLAVTAVVASVFLLIEPTQLLAIR